MTTRDPGEDIENEVINSEISNLETFFSQASCKYASFSLVLDLMHECYVISFQDVFEDIKKYLLCRVLPHINSQKL